MEEYKSFFNALRTIRRKVLDKKDASLKTQIQKNGGDFNGCFNHAD